jgi:hypothetical protein
MHTQYPENGNQDRQKKLVHLCPELMLSTHGCLLLSKTHEITWTRHERLSHGRNNNWQMMTSNQTMRFGKESCITLKAGVTTLMKSKVLNEWILNTLTKYVFRTFLLRDQVD